MIFHAISETYFGVRYQFLTNECNETKPSTNKKPRTKQKKKKNKGYTDHYEDVLPPAKTVIKMMHQMSIKE